MTTFLPKEVAQGLAQAQRAAMRKKSRLRVHIDGKTITVLKFWDTGFTVELNDAPQLRGLVDLYDGGRHLYQCLIVASDIDGDQIHYEFKRNTVAADKAPLDFERDVNAPIALLGI